MSKRLETTPVNRWTASDVGWTSISLYSRTGVSRTHIGYGIFPGKYLLWTQFYRFPLCVVAT